MASSWWSKYYKYRRHITYAGTQEYLSAACAKVYLPLLLIEQGKIREDLSDIRIVMNDSTMLSSAEYSVQIIDDKIAIQHTYDSPANFSSGYNTYDQRYHVYYGDFAGSAPDSFYPGATPNDEYDLPDDYVYGSYDPGPFSVVAPAYLNQSIIGITKPNEHWKFVEFDAGRQVLFSPQSAFGAKFSFVFSGSSVGLYCDVGPGYGKLEVAIDDISHDIDLYAEEEEANVLVFKAEKLAPNLHTLTATNTGKRNTIAMGLDNYYDEDLLENVPSNLYEPVNIYGVAYTPYVVGLIDNEEVTDTFNWNSKLGGSL